MGLLNRSNLDVVVVSIVSGAVTGCGERGGTVIANANVVEVADDDPFEFNSNCLGEEDDLWEEPLEPWLLFCNNLIVIIIKSLCRLSTTQL
jgi:hypothetical protein